MRDFELSINKRVGDLMRERDSDPFAFYFFVP